MIEAVLGGFFGGIAIVLWWLALSRARWYDRLGVLALMPFALWTTRQLADKSIATGAQGYLILMLAIPTMTVAFVACAVATSKLSEGARRAALAITILVGSGGWILARTGGFTAATFRNDLHWRWSKTPEERLLAQTANEPVPIAAAPLAEKAPEPAPVVEPQKKAAAEPAAPAPAAKAETGAGWPGFRGAHRDSVVTGVRIKTDWTASPPAPLWKRAVGPGWSSFAVDGNVFYTQEQRGPNEVVSCYRVSTGQPVWQHQDAARFWESNGGPGPRGTPTLWDGRVYTFGGTGIVNVLNERNGAVVWTRNAAAETGMKTPQWGFASSPLVVDEEVIVGVSGQLAAYDRASGAPKWTGPAHGVSYSSPQLATLGGVPQVLLLSETGAISVSPADGKVLWQYAWKGYPIIQPALTTDGDVLMAVTDSSGTKRLAVGQGSGGWNVEERWTSNGLKPYFNDFVIHNGYAYGFDGSILACIDLKDGRRKWKGGRYGNGQLVLLADQDVLLVLSEEGELALVSATPDQFKELAKAPAIEGKTWNHPVVAGDILLVRNGEQMAAFRLAVER